MDRLKARDLRRGGVYRATKDASWERRALLSSQGVRMESPVWLRPDDVVKVTRLGKSSKTGLRGPTDLLVVSMVRLRRGQEIALQSWLVPPDHPVALERWSVNA